MLTASFLELKLLFSLACGSMGKLNLNLLLVNVVINEI